MICPHCGKAERVHRSHSRGPVERVIKTVTPYKVYRCHDCNWRGWLIPGTHGAQPSLQSYKMAVIVFITGILIGLLIAAYFSWGNPGGQPPP